MGELVERATVKIDELGSWGWVCKEPCETGGRSGLEVPGGLDSRELS